MINVQMNFSTHVFLQDMKTGKYYAMSKHLYNNGIVPLKQLYGSLDQFPDSFIVFVKELKFLSNADHLEVSNINAKITLCNMYSPAVWLT